MAAELDIKKDGTAAIAYNSQDGAPWHRSGTPVNGLMTASEAMEKGGLDFGVETHDITLPDASGEKKDSGYRFIVRTDRQPPQNVLGVVKGRYIPIQNEDCFTFFDQFVEQGEAVYSTVGSLQGGRRVWIMAELPDTVEVARDDIVKRFTVLTNSHDGKEAAKVFFTDVRIVCRNTLRMAVGHAQTQSRIWHSGNIAEQFKAAQNLLGIAKKEFATSRLLWEEMVKMQLGMNDVQEFFKKVVPDNKDAKYPTRVNNIRGEMTRLFETGRGNDLPGVRGTLWAAYNGVTEYLDHNRMLNSSPERRLHSTWFGTGQTYRETALKAATTMLKG